MKGITNGINYMEKDAIDALHQLAGKATDLE